MKSPESRAPVEESTALPPAEAGEEDCSEALPVVEIVPAGEELLVGLTTPEERASDGPGGDGRDLPAPQGEALVAAVLALVFASPDPVPPARLAAVLGVEARAVRRAIEEARSRLSGMPFELVQLGGGWRLLTKPEHEAWIARLRGLRRSERLSGAALETLALVAYRQPITKAEIETIRGVQAAPVLRSLLERKLVRVVGRAPVPGRPIQYGTTREFLDRFGLASLEDLPRPDDVARG
jgi:segregation and condensation protein B